MIRVAFWNIERGAPFDLIAAALGADAPPVPERTRFRSAATPDPVAVLSDADVLVLNEVDLGMPRSGYRDVAADLAARLGMNYAYGVEFVELADLVSGVDSNPDAVDRIRYAGLPVPRS